MLSFFETPVTVIHIILCFFLGLVILIQPGRSGGLGAAFGGAGGQQVFGGRGAGDLLSKVTWIAATIFFITSMVLAFMSSSTTDTLEAPEPEFVAQELPAVEAPPSLPPPADAGAAATDTETEGTAAADEKAADAAAADEATDKDTTAEGNTVLPKEPAPEAPTEAPAPTEQPKGATDTGN